MESMIHEIASGSVRRSIKQVDNIILDCAKSLKSSDNVYKSNLLSDACSKLMKGMKSHNDTMNVIDSNERAFKEIFNKIQDKRPHDSTRADHLDARELLNDFDIIVANELKKQPTNSPQLRELESITSAVRPAEDEEMVIEEPERVELPKDPISKTNIQIAVRSKTCKHLYDKETIEKYIKSKKNKKARCPIAGCTNTELVVEDLEFDEEINKLIQSSV